MYAISLFTHLDEQLQFEWLDEIARILEPGGIALLTVHGRKSRERVLPPEDGAAVATRGFTFKVEDTGPLRPNGLPEFYQTAFHTEAYIRHNWATWFEVVAYREGAINHDQDAVILRRVKV